MLQEWFRDVLKESEFVEATNGDQFLTVYTAGRTRVPVKFYMCHQHGKQIGGFCPLCAVKFPGITGSNS
jgi:hypothetical protein